MIALDADYVNMLSTAVGICVVLAVSIPASQGGLHDPRLCVGVNERLVTFQSDLQKDLDNCEMSRDNNDPASYTVQVDINEVKDFIQTKEPNCCKYGCLFTGVNTLSDELAACRSALNDVDVDCVSVFGGSCAFPECIIGHLHEIGKCSDPNKACCILAPSG